jgi:hypothetical protein
LAIFRRKAIYEELHPETKATYAGGVFKGNQHSAVTDNLSITNFASATADATGKDERTIRRAAARGEALGDDLGAVTGTSLDKGVGEKPGREAFSSKLRERKPGHC